MKKILVADSGFWIALLREKDSHHNHSNCVYNKITKYYNIVVVIPWPTLYEFLKGEEVYLSYRFLEIIRQIENSKEKNMQILYYPDSNIKEKCLETYKSKVYNYIKINRRDRILSLVDMVILEILKEIKGKFNPQEIYLLSYDNLLKGYIRSISNFKLIEDLCK